MANNNLQSELLAAARGGSADDAQRLRAQMEQLTFIASQQVASLRDNTDALGANTAGRSTGNSAASVTKGVSQALGVGLFLSPLITGIAKLFNRDRSEPAVPEPTTLQRPAPVQLSGAVGPNGSGAYSAVDYSQDGTPRRVTAQPQVTIQIQALDSQSLLDRSDDLARAVRQAMLQSHGLNDVVSEF